MSGWSDFLVSLLGPQYAEGLPESAPKPPGYWAVEALRGAGGPLGILPGIPLGMLGSAGEAYTENVPMRIGAGLGQLLANTVTPETLRGLANTDVFTPTGLDYFNPLAPAAHLIQRGAGKLGLAALNNPNAPLTDPALFKEAYKDAGPVEQLLATTALDPTLIGQVPVLTGKIVRAGLPVLSGYAKGVETLANLPGQAIAKAGEGLVKAGGAALEKLAPGQLEQAASSLSGEAIKNLQDLIGNHPELVEALRFPMEKMGRYQIPTYASGMPDIEKARNQIATRWTRLEDIITNPLSAEDTVNNMQAWLAGQMARSHIQETLADSLAHDLGGNNATNRLEAVGAYQTWYDRSMRILDDIEAQFKKGGVEDMTTNPSAQVVATTNFGIPTGSNPGDINTLAGAVIPPHTVTNVANLTQPSREALTNSTALRDLVEQAVGEARMAVEDARSKIAMLRGPMNPANRDWVKARVNDIYRERNQTIIDAITNRSADIAAQFGVTPGTTAADEFNRLLASLEITATGGPMGAGLLPERYGQALSDLSSLWVPNVQKAQGAQANVARHLAYGLRLANKGAPSQAFEFGRVWDTLNDRLSASNLPALPALGEATSDQLTTAINSLVKTQQMDAAEARQTINILNSWKDRGDIMVADPLELALGPTKEQFEKTLGGAVANSNDITRNVVRGVRTVRQMLREGWLANTGYSFTNYLSALAFNFANDPAALKRSWTNTRQMLARYDYGMKNPGALPDLDYLPPDVGTLFKNIGLKATPADYGTGGYISANTQSIVDNRSAFERIPGWAKLGYGLATSPVDPVGAVLNTAFTALPAGKKVGPVPVPSLAGLVRTIRNITQVEEGAVRLAVGAPTTKAALDAAYPQFLQEVDKALVPLFRNTAMPMTGPVGTVGITSIAPVSLHAVVADLDALRTARGGAYFSPKDVADIMEKHGVHVDQAQQIVRGWAQHVDDAITAGTKEANRIHVDYGDYTNLEEKLDAVVPFTRWAIRMVPNFRDILVSSPAFVLGVQRLNTITKNEAEQLGLSDKYKRMVDVGPFGTTLAQTMFGFEGGKAFVDPSRVLSPWQNYVGAAQSSRYSGGPVQTIADMLPFKPYPDLQLPLQSLSTTASTLAPGISPLLPYSAEDPLPALSRFSGLAGLWGGDTRELWQSFYRALTSGENPYDFEKAAVQKRLGEMAMQDTGHPDNPLYLAARGREKGPLYEDALAQVRRERAVEQATGMMLPVGVQVVNGPELQVERAKTNLPTGRRDTLEKQKAFDLALQTNPAAAAHQGVQGSDLNTQVQRVFDVFRNPAMLFPDADPQVAARLAQKLAIYEQQPPQTQRAMKAVDPLIGAALARKNEFLKSSPARDYLYWRQQQHPEYRAPDEESLMAQFVAWLRQGHQAPVGWEP